MRNISDRTIFDEIIKYIQEEDPYFIYLDRLQTKFDMGIERAKRLMNELRKCNVISDFKEEAGLVLFEEDWEL